MAELTITKDNYKTLVTRSDLPVLLDFWAAWCGPCRKLAPVIQEVAARQKECLIVGKINIDEQPELAAAFGITAIPTLVVVKNGKIVNRATGYRDIEDINALL